jgi:hypothetical protein
LIEIAHNFEPSAFMWLWAKYVTGFNPEHHCTNCIRGKYSHKFSKNNPGFAASRITVMDEQPPGSYIAIYICGVSKAGYSRKANYPHNVHIALAPRPRAEENWSFEKWTVNIRNAVFLPIPSSADDLPVQYQTLPPAYTTCRIFRWSACFFGRPSL